MKNRDQQTKAPKKEEAAKGTAKPAAQAKTPVGAGAAKTQNPQSTKR